MALVYCDDPAQPYCFALTRDPERAEIELMVSDQVFTRLADLDLALHGNTLTAHLGAAVAQALDGTTHYTIHLQPTSEERQQLVQALEKIFEGKQGFRQLG